MTATDASLSRWGYCRCHLDPAVVGAIGWVPEAVCFRRVSPVGAEEPAANALCLLRGPKDIAPSPIVDAAYMADIDGALPAQSGNGSKAVDKDFPEFPFGLNGVLVAREDLSPSSVELPWKVYGQGFWAHGETCNLRPGLYAEDSKGPWCREFDKVGVYS